MSRRPSLALFYREHPAARDLLAEGAEPYGWGYEGAQLDLAAGLAPMTDAEHSSTWHADYAEGYRDAIADAERFER